MFNTSREFEDDLNRLDETERTEVIERINYACSGTACGEQGRLRPDHEPRSTQAQERGCCSSLSILPAGRRSAVILAVDDDPIFDQVIVSLIRVVGQRTGRICL